MVSSVMSVYIYLSIYLLSYLLAFLLYDMSHIRKTKLSPFFSPDQKKILFPLLSDFSTSPPVFKSHRKKQAYKWVETLCLTRVMASL